MSKKNPKCFRINQLRVDSVHVDTEPTKVALMRNSTVEWDDLVVSITTDDGSVFEVARVPVLREGLIGECTYVADLKHRRSWGAETDDDSVSCPLCFHPGHGAGVCRDKR